MHRLTLRSPLDPDLERVLEALLPPGAGDLEGLLPPGAGDLEGLLPPPWAGDLEAPGLLLERLLDLEGILATWSPGGEDTVTGG